MEDLPINNTVYGNLINPSLNQNICRNLK